MSLGSVLGGTSSLRRGSVRAHIENLECRRLMSAGDLDITFGDPDGNGPQVGGVVTTNFAEAPNVRDDIARAVVVSDGMIISVGDSVDSSSGGGFALTRHTSAGVLDTGFGTGGRVRTTIAGLSLEASAAAIDSAGGIVVAGRAIDQTDFSVSLFLVRYDADGTLDTSWGNGGRAQMPASAVGTGFSGLDDVSLVIGSGGIYVGFTAFRGFFSEMGLARVSGDGAFNVVTTPAGAGEAGGGGGGGAATSGGIAIDAAGGIVQAGTYGQVDEDGNVLNRKLLVARFNSDGTRDSSGYGVGGVLRSGTAADAVESVFVDADAATQAGRGSLVIAAAKDDGTGKLELVLGRVAGDGSADESRATGLFSLSGSYALGIQRDGKLVVAGGDDAGVPNYVLARFDEDFMRDAAFGGGDGVYVSGLHGDATGVTTDANGDILVTGYVEQASGIDFFLARHDSDASASGVTADANADNDDYAFDEGQPVVLNGAGSSNPGGVVFLESQRRAAPNTVGGGGGTVTFAWDIDGDMDFDDDADEATITLDGGALDGPGKLDVYLKVSDASGAFAIDHAEVNVKNLAPSAQIVLPPSQVEGQSVTLTSEVTDPSSLDTFSYAWTLVEGVVLEQGATNGPDFAFTPADNGSYKVRLQVFDDDGGYTTEEVTFAVANANPTVAIDGGNRTVDEGAGLSFTATTGDVAADSLAYAWTVTRDGNGYAGGSLAAFGFVPDDDGVYEVSLTVTDKDGGVTVSAPVVVTANNVAATADATGAQFGLRGEERTLTLGATDPGDADVQAGFTYTVDWADGSPVETVEPGSNVTELRHVYQQVGTFEVKVTAADKDRRPTDPPLVPQVVTMISQGSALENGVLSVSGSTGNDILRLFRSNGSVAVGNITSGGIEYVQTYSQAIGRVVIIGQAGNDHIDASALNVPVEVYGGPGNDRLVGGSAADILVGGGGDDRIAGNGGRDVMIGGRGSDRILGNAEEDILVGGHTSHDADLVALRLIAAEWTNTTRSYQQRIANLEGATSTGSNGSALLLANVTTWDDNAVDVLSGEAGRDWFFFNNDRVTGRDRVIDATSIEELEEVDPE